MRKEAFDKIDEAIKPIMDGVLGLSSEQATVQSFLKKQRERSNSFGRLKSKIGRTKF